ncbi:basement membrane-specific heparan sulfate proteoglycan core protein-like [Engraulis encrasicolus]|uniref:basement membrane-specific heparan sulfate proteoglycan core protein-like n=1 Tax=Engraulis encrasicolus TaxID=184585 RepID=UPI002FD584E2
MRCDIAGHQDWSRYIWYKDDNLIPNKNSKTITISLPNEAGQYTCEGRLNDRLIYSHQGGRVPISATALPTATVSVVSPQGPYYPGDRVTLRCDIAEHTDWDKYYWYRDSSYISTGLYQSSSISLPEQPGQYQFTCEGQRSSRPEKSQRSKPTAFTLTAMPVPTVKISMNPVYHGEAVTLTCVIEPSALPTPTLAINPEGPVYTGETVTMTCVIESLGGWRYQWYKGSSSVPVSEGNIFTIDRVAKDQKGQYWCQGVRTGRPTTSQSTRRITLDVKESKPQLTLSQNLQLFTGDSVTLTCELDISSGLLFYWYKDTQTSTPVAQTNRNFYIINSAKVSDGGQYWCRAGRGDPVYYTQYSNEVLLNVTEKAKAVVSVSSQPWLTEGDSVKLSCKVEESSGGWKFNWSKVSYNPEESPQSYQRLPDSSRGAGGSYTLSPAALRHTGVYVCRAERGEPAYKTEFSQPQPVWIRGVSPNASVVSHPNWAQILTREPLSLSCGAQGNSTGWSLMWFTGRGGGSAGCPTGWRSETGSTCSTSSASSSDSGVYWCQSESGEQSNPVNITVHDGDVILESPVHPVMEGDPLTLRCRYRDQPSNISADFYKDGTLLHTSRTGEMTIPAVSKSHEGLYKCNDTEKGESPESWITVMPKSPPASVVVRPNRTQHFVYKSLSLSCETAGNSEPPVGWRLRWFTEDRGEMTECPAGWRSVVGSTCTIVHPHTSDSGVYWCQSEAGLRSNPVNVTFHDTDVLLESPAHPVTEGDPLTLHCRYRKAPSKATADIFKDGMHLQPTLTGELTILAASQAHEGRYRCRHAERGDSADSWVSVRPRDMPTDTHLMLWLLVGLFVSLALLILLATLLYHYRVSGGGNAPVNRHVMTIVEQQLWRRRNMALYGFVVRGAHAGPSEVVYTDIELKEMGRKWYVSGKVQTRPPGDVTSFIIICGKTEAAPTAVLSSVCQPPFYSGEFVTLRCDIMDYTDWHLYVWSRDNKTGWGRHEIYNETGSTLTVKLPHDAAWYSCRGQRNSDPHESSESVEVHVTYTEKKPTPRISADRRSPVFTGNDVTLSCDMGQSTGWSFYWFRHKPNSAPVAQTDGNFYSISSANVSDGGQYWCRAGRGDPVYYTRYSSVLRLKIVETPRAVITQTPSWPELFSGESLSLACDIPGLHSPHWQYSWYKNGKEIGRSLEPEYTINDVMEFHGGNYSCRGMDKSNLQTSEFSEAIRVIISEKPCPVLRGPAQPWLTEGDSVTLSCEVSGSSAGWTFHWYKTAPYRPGLSFVSQGNGGYYLDLLDNEGSYYTLKKVTLRDSGVYVCIGKRVHYYSYFSSPQPVWVTVIVEPSKSQYFPYSDPLLVSCEEFGPPSAEWRLRWLSEKEMGEKNECPSHWTGAGSTCSTSSASPKDSGVYWCQSESGEQSNPINITVHPGNVILESPVQPVTRGDPLTLRCRHRHWPSNISADFYKDGLLLNYSSTGEMTIPAVSKSHEGLYKCRNPEKGESPESWITVTVRPSRSCKESTQRVLYWTAVGLVVSLALLRLFIWLCCFKKSRGLVTPAPVNGQQKQHTPQNQDGGQPAASDGAYSEYYMTMKEAVDDTHVYANINLNTQPQQKRQDNDVLQKAQWHENDDYKAVLSKEPNWTLMFTRETVSFACSITGASSNSYYKWDKTDKDSGATQGMVPWSKQQVYNISYVSKTDSGIYTCSVDVFGDGKFTESNPVNLTVRDLPPTPKVTILSPEAPYYKGDKITLSCDIAEQTTWAGYKTLLIEFEWKKAPS